MKTKTTLISIFMVFSSLIRAQWVTEVSALSPAGLGINCISIVNSNVVWATAFDTAGTAVINKFTRTLNGGTTWTAGNVNGASAFDLSSISSYNKDTAWVSMLNNNVGGGGIYRTNNGGTTWTSQPTATFAAPGGSTDFVYMFDKNNGVCVGDSNTGYWEIYKTTNGGTNWARITLANIPSNTIGEIGFENGYFVVGNTLWFGTSNGRVYRSTNMGATWTVATTGLTQVTRVAFKDASNGIATDGTLLVKSTNGGISWTPLAFTGTFYDGGLCYVPGTVGTYVCTGNGSGNNGSAYSIDDGATWINIDALRHYAVAFLNSTTGWSGDANQNATTKGIYKWTGAFTSVGIKGNVNVIGISLNVFPNPFKDHLTLTIDSEKSKLTNLSVEITDLLGRSIINRNDFVENKIIISRGDLISGVYFYKVYNSNLLIGTGRLIAQ